MAEQLYVLQLTRSELELLHTEFNASVDCGAEDADFPRVRDKAAAALRAAPGEVGINGLTEAETSATASVMGIVGAGGKR